MNDTLTPLYPSAAYQTRKDSKTFHSVALYASATLARALGTIEGAELDAKHAQRTVWAEMDAAASGQSGAQALLNLATIYDNRAGGPTETGDALTAAAQEIWTLCAAQAEQADPAPTFSQLREALSNTTGMVIAAIELDTNRK